MTEYFVDGESAAFALSADASGPGGVGILAAGRKMGIESHAKTSHGVYGGTESINGGAGVYGVSGAQGAGIIGVSYADPKLAVRISTKGEGGIGFSGPKIPIGIATDGAIMGLNLNDDDSGAGVYGSKAGPQGAGLKGVHQANGHGVHGDSALGEGVRGETNSTVVAAIAGYNRNPLGVGAAVYGHKAGEAGHAGYFDGDVHVTRRLTAYDICSPCADCAEDFDFGTDADPVEPGTVMVLDEAGTLVCSSVPFDKRVVGVVSGAGRYRPGLVLDRREGVDGRLPIALLGKVCCRVDAGYGAIGIGDLLTTSATPGHAMAAGNPAVAAGAVIGKALKPLATGRGLIPVLVMLR